jgi:outer membrane protein OmpA-like peptidoglycan-associated protein
MNEASRSGVMMIGGLVLPAIAVVAWLSSAQSSLERAKDAASEVAIASAAEDEYCSPQLKQILRRVAGACGLLQEGGRGCKPTDAKTVAAMSGPDFNALFKPLSHRAKIVQFDSEQIELDEGGKKLVEEAWSDQRGASFFFVVARASADGDAAFNQQLSQNRAEAVLKHLETKFQDPDLKQEVGLLWLGEEFAQLSEEFCGWGRSRASECSIKDINRSAFVAWIDCAI